MEKVNRDECLVELILTKVNNGTQYFIHQSALGAHNARTLEKAGCTVKLFNTDGWLTITKNKGGCVMYNKIKVKVSPEVTEENYINVVKLAYDSFLGSIEIDTGSRTIILRRKDKHLFTESFVEVMSEEIRSNYDPGVMVIAYEPGRRCNDQE